MNNDNTIAFMGVAGANADLACRVSEPYMQSLPCPTFEAVFEAVRDGKARLGMIPMENSQAGRVAEIHQLLPEMDLHIVGETFLPVRHVLAGVESASMNTVVEAYSHPQALMQCRKHLNEHGITPCVFSNTAVAAKSVKEWNDPGKAALCSELAAELYGLKVIHPGMQDSDDNTTTFITLARDPLEEFAAEDRLLTSLHITLRNLPSALYKSLGGFATNGVNIVKLESYIASGATASAKFFLTFEGNPEEELVKNALEELDFYTQNLSVLGVYPAAKERHYNKKGI